MGNGKFGPRFTKIDETGKSIHGTSSGSLFLQQCFACFNTTDQNYVQKEKTTKMTLGTDQRFDKKNKN